MKNRTLYILAVLLAILCAGALAAWRLSRPSPAPRLADRNLPAKTAYLDIGFSTTTFSFAKTSGKWEMTSPFPYPADGTAIEAVLSRLPEVEISEEIGTAKDRLEVGLSDPTRIQASDQSKKPLLDILAGKEGKNIDTFYFQTSPDSPIRQAAGVTPRVFSRIMSDWLDRRIVSLPKDGVSKIVLCRDGCVTLQKDKDIWTAAQNGKVKTVSDKDTSISPILKLFANMEADLLAPLTGQTADTRPFKTKISAEITVNGQSTPVILNFSDKESGETRRIKKVGEERTLFVVGDWKLSAITEFSFKNLQ